MSLVLPIPVNYANVFKYIFEATLISWATSLLASIIGRCHVRRLLNSQGYIVYDTATLQNPFLNGAPRSVLALIVGAAVHTIMVLFELGFDASPGAHGIRVSVSYPLSSRESGLSGPIWAEAANWCCEDAPDGPTTTCWLPVRLNAPVDGFSSNHNLWLNGKRFACVGDLHGMVGVARPKKVSVAVLQPPPPQTRNFSRCSVTRKNSTEMVLCGLSLRMRITIIRAFEGAAIPYGRDPFIEFWRYYVAAGLWKNNDESDSDLVLEDGVAYNREYNKTAVSPPAAAVFLLLVLILTLRLLEARDYPVRLPWGLEGLISVLYEGAQYKADPRNEASKGSQSWWRRKAAFLTCQYPRERIYMNAQRTGPTSARLVVDVEGNGEPGLLYSEPRVQFESSGRSCS